MEKYYFPLSQKVSIFATDNRIAMDKKDNVDKPRIHWILALIPLAVLVALQVLVIREFGSDALEGASQTVLLVAVAVAVAMGMLFFKVPWRQIDHAIADNVKTISGAILILFLIGAVSGSWMLSGVVPTMIYYGMQIVDPSVFLFVACLVCALVSVVTGSSWTTIATIGIALMGIGTAHGYSVGWTAGAIISSAYFGDKISPLSDTTVLVPWNTCGMTQSLVLHVPTLTYLPYCFFNILSPLMSITIAMLGYKIFRTEEK